MTLYSSSISLIKRLQTAFGLFMLLLTGIGCGNNAPNSPASGRPPEVVIPVEVKPVIRRDISESVELVGTVRSRHRVQIAAEISGIVRENVLRDGDSFQKGDLLLQLDSRDYQIQLQVAKAELSQTEQRLNELLRGTRKEIIEQHRAAVKRQEAILQDAELNLQRTQSLFEKQVRTQSQLDEARYARDQAAAQLAEAKARLQQAENGATEEEIAASRAAVATRQAQVEQAERNLEKTSIVAPFDGMIVRRLAEVGGFVNPGAPLLDIISSGEMDLYFDVPERLISRIQVGSLVQVRSDALPGLALQVEVAAVIPAADNLSRNIPVRCILPENNGLKPGMLARVILETGRKEDVLVVPQDALLADRGMSLVYVAREGTAVMVPVSTGLRTDRMIEVSGDLQENELVIVIGNEVLSPGARISIANGKSTRPGEAPGT